MDEQAAPIGERRRPGRSSESTFVDVRLRDVPISIRQRTVQHSEELVREMSLIAQDLDEPHARKIPEQLIKLVEDVRTTYAAYTAGPLAELDALAERGETTAREIVYRVPPAAAEVARWMNKVLTEADEFCRQGEHLLTLASPADVVAYRAWTLREFERQIDGEDALPWPEYAAREGVTPEP